MKFIIILSASSFLFRAILSVDSYKSDEYNQKTGSELFGYNLDEISYKNEEYNSFRDEISTDHAKTFENTFNGGIVEFYEDRDAKNNHAFR
ncbi:hypothetical protein AYI69_g2417 [Smittium culicis]|uniref:Uncharacterized protein n=1 Tax=Smittium culicis TaxID=133412 RepID=A0A1R1YML2_9FUNG|nr:hypothetical protein AYI69_g2417 [Smittium culicis]